MAPKDLLELSSPILVYPDREEQEQASNTPVRHSTTLLMPRVCPNPTWTIFDPGERGVSKCLYTCARVPTHVIRCILVHYDDPVSCFPSIPLLSPVP